MAVMAPRKRKQPKKPEPKPVNPAWAERLTSLQSRLALSNAEIAEKFGVEVRTYLSWKYGERNLSPTAAMLLSMLEQRK